MHHIFSAHAITRTLDRPIYHRRSGSPNE